MGVRRHGPGALDEPVVLGARFREVRRDGQPELEARPVERGRARVRRVRRDPEADAIGERGSDPLPVRLEARLEVIRPSEDLQVDDRSQPELVGGDCRRSGEACVRHRGHARGKALGGAKAGDRGHVLEVEPALSLHVQLEPRAEREPLAEAGVDRVLEVGVRVDEAGHDRALWEIVATVGREVVSRADGQDQAVADGDTAALDRGSVDGQDPVGRVDLRHGASLGPRRP